MKEYKTKDKDMDKPESERTCSWGQIGQVKVCHFASETDALHLLTDLAMKYAECEIKKDDIYETCDEMILDPKYKYITDT